RSWYGAYSSLVTSSGARPPSRSRRSSSSSSTFSGMRRPTTTLSTSRASASRATWSHWSPRKRSPSSSGSQCFSFLPTKDHFSSSCTLAVRGGKGHELVVEPAGVVAGQQGVAGGRVLVDAHQPPRLADAAALLRVLQQRQGLLRRQSAVEQGRPLALGEAGLAGAAAEQAALVGAVAAGDGEVAGAAPAAVGAGGVEA